MDWGNPDSLIAMGVVFPVLSIAAVGARFYARAKQSANYKVDDWLMIPALLLIVGIGVALIVGTAGHGTGYEGFPLAVTQHQAKDAQSHPTGPPAGVVIPTGATGPPAGIVIPTGARGPLAGVVIPSTATGPPAGVATSDAGATGPPAWVTSQHPGASGPPSGLFAGGNNPLTGNTASSILTKKTEFAVTLCFIAEIALVKLSILFFLRRIFVVGHHNIFNVASLVMIGTIILWAVAFFFGWLFTCGSHISRLWASVFEQHMKCSNGLALQEAYAISDAVLDVVVFFMPLYPISTLKLSLRKKVGLSLVFLLGATAVIASLFRAVIVVQVTTRIFARQASEKDPNLLISRILWWTTLEGGLALITANLPTLNALIPKDNPIYSGIRRVLPSSLGSGSKSKPSTQGSGKQASSRGTPWRSWSRSRFASAKGEGGEEVVELRTHGADVEAGSVRSVPVHGYGNGGRGWHYPDSAYYAGT